MAIAAGFALSRGRTSALLRTVHERALFDEIAQRAEVAGAKTLDPTVTRDVVRGLGAALDLDPRRLRLSDRLDALFDMQPSAGVAQRETFETWLHKRYSDLPDHMSPDTVGDLIEELQQLPRVR